MILLQNVSDQTYRGWDRGLNKAVVADPGDVFSVSEAEASALTSDFPTWFEVVGESPCVHDISAAAPSADNVIDARTVTKPARASRRKAT